MNVNSQNRGSEAGHNYQEYIAGQQRKIDRYFLTGPSTETRTSGAKKPKKKFRQTKHPFLQSTT